MNATSWVKNKLIKDGFVTNWECIDKRITTRLGSIICNLRQAGWEIDGDFIDGTKNFKYTYKGKGAKNARANRRHSL